MTTGELVTDLRTHAAVLPSSATWTALIGEWCMKAVHTALEIHLWLNLTVAAEGSRGWPMLTVWPGTLAARTAWWATRTPGRESGQF